jgi:CHAD domain-containing protein
MALQPRRKVSAAASQDSGLLEGLFRERLRKFMALLLKVLAEGSDEAVHDLRVWSRRLQQVITTFSPSPRPPQARTMVRALRRARRSLGGWRDCDVLIELLERKARRIRKPEEKKVCEMVRALALNKREREIRRARRRLASRKLFALAHRAQRFLDELAQGERQDAPRVLATSIADGYAQWRRALSFACDGFDPANIHAFRIRTKQLRYRIELVRDLGEHDAQAALGFLRSLQDELGRWHDKAELFRLTAEALADPEFLLKHTRLVAVLLHKSDREQTVQQQRIQRLLTSTLASVEGSTLNHWIVRYCRELQPQPSGAPQPSAKPQLLAAPQPSAEPQPNEPTLNSDDCVAAPKVVQVREIDEVQEVQDHQALRAEPVEDLIKAMSDLPA